MVPRSPSLIKLIASCTTILGALYFLSEFEVVWPQIDARSFVKYRVMTPQQHQGEKTQDDGDDMAMMMVDGKYCPAIRYAKVDCPVWDNDEPDGGDDVDVLVRWVHQNQNPKDCSKANYLLR